MFILPYVHDILILKSNLGGKFKAATCASDRCTIIPPPCERASIAQGQLGYIHCSISKYVMSIYDAKIGLIKCNLYKKPRSYRRMYLNIDIH